MTIEALAIIIRNMQQLLKRIFQNTSPVKFKKFSPFLSLFADIILVQYISNQLIARLLNKEQLMPALIALNPQIQNLSPYELDNLVQLMGNTMSFLFLVILGFNTIMYILAAREKKIGIKFTYGYTLSAALLSIVELIGSMISPLPFSWATFFTFFMYGYVYLGMRYFKQNEAR